MNALIIHPTDNVAVVTAPIRAGECVCCLRQGQEIRLTAAEDIPCYHKIALCDIDRGQAVIKYAHPIGVATVPIAKGAYVHRHNVVSPNQNTEVRP